MNDLIMKLRLLAKAEAILVRLYLRRAVRQVSLVLAAALFGLLALAMLNVALYFSFEPRFGQASAALAVAGLDLLLAVVAVVAASRLGLGPDAVAAELLRDRVSSELVADADRIRTQLDDLGQDIKGIREAVTGFTNPGGIDFPLVFQWLMMLVSFLRKKWG
jgi:pilus assembly protein TadC